MGVSTQVWFRLTMELFIHSFIHSFIHYTAFIHHAISFCVVAKLHKSLSCISIQASLRIAEFTSMESFADTKGPYEPAWLGLPLQ